jgi:hypothetical protein
MYKDGIKPHLGIDPTELTPEYTKILTQGSPKDQEIAAFRWLMARSKSKEE